MKHDQTETRTIVCYYLPCQPRLDCSESGGYAFHIRFRIIPEILFFKGEGGRREIAHRDSQIESSLSFLSFLVPWQEFEAIRSSLVGGEPSGASIKDSFEDLSRLNRRGNRVCVNVTADHQLASPRPSSWVSRGSFDIYIYIYTPLNK